MRFLGHSALRTFILAVFSGIAPVICSAQSPYTFSTGRELAIILPGLAFEGGSHLIKPDLAGLWLKAQATDRSELWAFDRQAAFKWSPAAAHTSDLLLITGIGSAVAMALIFRPSPGMGAPSALLGETALLSIGLTDLAKKGVHRARPYAYNPTVPDALRMSNDAYSSFWSGHTASTAAITFATAQMVEQSDASKATKSITWTAAATWPMLVGFYRVRAGKHFPTDVIVGYFVGAGIGLAVPYLHQIGKQKE